MIQKILKTDILFYRTLLVLLLLAGCSKESKVIITRDFVYNENWGEDNLPSVSFSKIQIDTLKIETDKLNKYSAFEIYNNILRDSNYYKKNRLKFDYTSYYENEKITNLEKIYFNRENAGILWHIRGAKWENSAPVFGKLQNNCWYEFFRLNEWWNYIVYIDKNGVSHVWAIKPVNI